MYTSVYKCIKIFFGYPRRPIHSATAMLSDLGLPTLPSLLIKCQLSFREQGQNIAKFANTLVRHFVNMFGYLF